MRAAKIGTIMPWGGDGGTGFLESNIPKGWITCTGQTLSAADYPLLAAALGDTYGGDMTDSAGDHYEFPYYGTEANFRLPQLSNTVMMDLERSYLDDPTYQMGQDNPADAVYDEEGNTLGDLIVDFGETEIINSTYEASCDIDFTLNLAGNLYFKFDNITLTAPDFLETVYTLNRKLGINHTPSHGHSDSLVSVNPNASGPMVFRTDQGIEMTGDASPGGPCDPTEGPNTCSLAESEPTTWQEGAVNLTFYGDATKENTLPRCDNFMEFVNDSTGKNYWGFIPAGEDNWTTTDILQANGGSGQASTTYTQTIFARQQTEQIIDTTPVDTHKTPCHTGYFPRPMEERSRPNFFGYNTGSPIRADGLIDDPETAPVFSVTSVTLTTDSNTFTLPAGTDIRRGYVVGSESWYQYDRITPLMYVNSVSRDNKYHNFREGTMVQTIENTGTEAAPIYEIRTNFPVRNGGTVDITFRHGAWPTSMNLAKENKDPKEQSYRAHNHGSFEISQTIGSMASPPSHTANDADGSSLTADSLENALNITCDTSQPNLTMTFIIKAY